MFVKNNFAQFWDKEQIVPLLTNLKLTPGTAEYNQFNNAVSSSHTEDHNPAGIPFYQPSFPSSHKKMRCSHCNTSFESREEQVAHYSLEWHRANLKRSMNGLVPISSKNFNKFEQDETIEANESDDASSFDEEEDKEISENEEDIFIRKQPRIFFTNSDKEIVSIYRSVLFNKRNEPSSENELIFRASASTKKHYWVILLIGGGHFAGAVFKGEEVITHKTFHSYTVRAKQGGSQSARDNKNATSHPRSAGASIRRYNEQSHLQHIQELMTEWADHVKGCDLVFYRCPKNHQHILFGGQTPPFSRNDSRLRTIPFVTKRASFSECKKVHQNLARVIIHDNSSDLQIGGVTAERKQKNAFSSGGGVKKEPKNLTKRMAAVAEQSVEENNDRCSSEEFGPGDELESGLNTLHIRDLDPYGFTFGDEEVDKKAKKKRKKKDPEALKSPIKEKSPQEQSLENIVYTSCLKGDLSMMKAILELSENNDFTNISDLLTPDVMGVLSSLECPFKILDFKFGPFKKTLLHVAAEKGHKHLLWWLLEKGCDPSIENKRKETPYEITKNKDLRNHFRRFMAQYPDKYEYTKSKIPSPLTSEMEKEIREKKKRQQKVKAVKVQEEKLQLLQQKKEQEEKSKFLQLSDREKRAIAAERRLGIVKPVGTTILRCFQCAQDLSHIEPFSYSNYQFCSTACVRLHRVKLKDA